MKQLTVKQQLAIELKRLLDDRNRFIMRHGQNPDVKTFDARAKELREQIERLDG